MIFLVDFKFPRLDKFDGPIFGGYIQGMGAYIWDVNWVTYLGCISGGTYIRGTY